MKFLNKILFAIVLLIATSSASIAQISQQDVKAADSSTTITTKVKGITCSTDLKMISANVEKLEGVSSCKAGKTGPTTTFEIAYNPSLVTEKEIHAAIQNTGSCEKPDERPYKVKQ